MPYFRVVVAFAVLGVILWDLFGIGVQRGTEYIDGRIGKRKMFRDSVKQDINRGSNKW